MKNTKQFYSKSVRSDGELKQHSGNKSINRTLEITFWKKHECIIIDA